MTDRETYQTAVRTVALAAKMISQFDLPQLLEDIARADIVGPIVDPTMWIQNGEAMRQDAAMLKAALPLHRLGKKLEKCEDIDDDPEAE